MARLPKIGSKMQEVRGSNPRLGGLRVSQLQASGEIRTLQSRPEHHAGQFHPDRTDSSESKTNNHKQHLARGDDTVENPHRAQVDQFELFEFILLMNQTSTSLSSNSRQQHLSQQYPPPPLRCLAMLGDPETLTFRRLRPCFKLTAHRLGSSASNFYILCIILSAYGISRPARRRRASGSSSVGLGFRV